MSLDLNADSSESSDDNDGSSAIDSMGNDSMLSIEEVERIIRESRAFQGSGSNFNGVTQAVLVVAFTVLIVFGTAGNSLVCYVVLANRHMRTPRNVLITNLAASDLILCLFTQPFNLLKVSMSTWKLGTVLCKLVPMVAGTNVYVSTLSITAIALDRFHLIVHPTERDLLLMKSGSVAALLSIWTLSLVMASPMLIFSTTNSVYVSGLKLFEVCVENPEYHYAKAAYSVASMIVQYLLPIAIVSVAHAQICNKLRYRMSTSRGPRAEEASSQSFQTRKHLMEETRKRKTNRLLVTIAVVFAASWMPLNVFNIIADFDQDLLLTLDKSGLVFAVCHLLVLGSACANPVLYGWLNDNFRQEFVRVLCGRCAAGRSPCPCCPSSAEDPERVPVIAKRAAVSCAHSTVDNQHLLADTAVHLREKNKSNFEMRPMNETSN